MEIKVFRFVVSCAKWLNHLLPAEWSFCYEDANSVYLTISLTDIVIIFSFPILGHVKILHSSP